MQNRFTRKLQGCLACLDGAIVRPFRRGTGALRPQAAVRAMRRGIAVICFAAPGGCAEPRWAMENTQWTAPGDGGQPAAEREHPWRAADVGTTADEAPQHSPADDFTLAHLLELADKNDPRIAMARDGVGVATGLVQSARVYPNPTLELSAEEIPTAGPIDDSKAIVGIRQPIVIGGRRDAAIGASRARLGARDAEVEAVRREVFAEVELLVRRVVLVRQGVEAYGEMLAVAEKLSGEARARVEARASPEADAVRAQAEVERLRAQGARLELELPALARRLSLIVGQEIDPARIAPDPAPRAEWTIEELSARVRADHPAIEAAQREADAAEQRVRQIRAERVPDLDLRIAGGEGAQDEGTIVEAGLEVRLPLWDTSKGAELSARFEAARAKRGVQEVERALLSELSALWGQYESARAETAGLRDRIVPMAVRAAELAAEGWRGGRGGFVDVIEAQRAAAEARERLLEATREETDRRVRIKWLTGEGSMPVPSAGPGKENHR
jgi:cobalt-zinc-cadmium efflux system outer membrane protein